MDADFSQDANAILTEAANKLRALGFHCAIGSLSLPQGRSLNLHVGESVLSVAAAFVAIGRGGDIASAENTDLEFASEVSALIAIDAIEKVARAAEPPAPRFIEVSCLFCDDNDPWLLPIELKDEFVAGRRFHVRGRIIHLGWSGQPEHDFAVDSLLGVEDGISVRADVRSESDRIRYEVERLRQADESRRRNGFVDEITAELARTSYRPFDAAAMDIAQWEGKLSQAGFASLKAYIQRLPGRLVHQAADRMMNGESLQTAISTAAADLLARSVAQPGKLLKARKNRPDGYSPHRSLS